jgi:hypothetical protein
MISGNPDFPQRANAILLLALCYRDGISDVDRFCARAEEALAMNADLLNEASTRIALFNGYLAKNPQSVDLAAQHLYQASQKTNIEPDNLRWLSDYYFAKSACDHQDSPVFLQRSFDALSQLLTNSKINIHSLDEQTLSFESAVVRLADLQGRLGQTLQQMELLQSLKRQYAAHPSWAWKKESETDLLLGMNYKESGQTDLALPLFDGILAKSPSMRSPASAAASLQSARIRLKQLKQKNLSCEDPDALKILTQLKTLILQKSLPNEPIHLDAAIEYVDFQAGFETDAKSVEKRLALLTKMKTDFESSNDLLSCDYQNNRKILPEKDRLLTAYMDFVDAEILFCHSKLAQEPSDRYQYQQKAKKSLETIAAKPINDFIALKAREHLEQMDGR